LAVISIHRSIWRCDRWHKENWRKSN
jgi:hypothetical protein